MLGVSRFKCCRKPKGIGIDTASIDYGQSSDFESHQIMGKRNVWGLENLNNLADLPSTGFQVYNMVHFLKEGSGGPSRVVAAISLSSTAGSSTQELSFNLVTLIVAIICITKFNIQANS